MWGSKPSRLRALGVATMLSFFFMGLYDGQTLKEVLFIVKEMRHLVSCEMRHILHRRRSIGHWIDHIHVAFSTGLQAIFPAWARAR